MAQITIEELSDSLKEYLNGLGLTEAQVQELIDKFEDEKIGDISQLSTEEKGNLVGAINELFQSANNGKELIANAIGEPLSSEDTFSAMSTDINGLLSTFKTNMMNNGITVESSDRFKALIDKIATLADNEGKGVQYVTGTVTVSDEISYDFLSEDGTENGALYIDLSSLSFVPSVVIAMSSSNTNNLSIYVDKVFDFYFTNYYNTKGKSFTIRSYSDTSSGIIFHSTSNNLKIAAGTTGDYIYHAIGVGEEDTTLRDSLASILEEEGVDVTEEDDMASLISKVDEEFDRKNANAVSLISGTSYTLLNSTELDVYNEMINKEVLYTHNYPGGVIKFSTLIENMGRTDSDGWYTAYNSTYLVVNHIRNGETISSVTYRHKIAYEDYGENEVEQSVDYTVENGDILQFLGNAPQGVSYCIPYIKLTADIQW